MPDTSSPQNAAALNPDDPAFERAVVAIIAKKKKLDPATINHDSTFQELGIDSLDGIDLVFTFEDEFNISIPDHIVQKMKSVGQVVEALREVLAKRTLPPA
jgi:acyl carrier protein